MVRRHMAALALVLYATSASAIITRRELFTCLVDDGTKRVKTVVNTTVKELEATTGPVVFNETQPRVEPDETRIYAFTAKVAETFGAFDTGVTMYIEGSDPKRRAPFTLFALGTSCPFRGAPPLKSSAFASNIEKVRQFVATNNLTGKTFRFQGVPVFGAGSGGKAPISSLTLINIEPADGSSPDPTGSGGGTPPGVPSKPFSVVLPAIALETPVTLQNGGETVVNISTAANAEFDGEITLAAVSEPEGLDVSVIPAVIPRPGRGEAAISIAAGPLTLPRDYRVIVTATSGEQTTTASFPVSLLCDPPMILGLDQPKSATITHGGVANLSVKPIGSAPFQYQWYSGHSGQTHFPLAGGTGATLTTSAIRDTAHYWVRISNACGSVDSNTATVTVTGATSSTRPRG